ncbi:MAG: D-sedoheptulose 7-phosphate isomerase [Bacteroidales bacterium]|jgi:D-sedoheptulose 7-phosphate isomerase|nr:D-sedoheptulose 7-phosphate isomerase [Bacteroidales bacterium]
MKDKIRKQIKDAADLKLKLLESAGLLENIEKASIAIVKAFRCHHKLLIAGNGGSAADAQHIAAEFVNKFNFDRLGLPAIALTTDTSILTSVGNDSSFQKVFARQVSAIGSEGDILLAISTSGKSYNIVEALKEARENRMLTIGITGASGGTMKDLCDICLVVPSEETPRIQEAQILIEHIICSIVEEELFSRK